MFPRTALVVFALSLAARLIFVAMSGVRSGTDTARYVGAAELWQANGWSPAWLLTEYDGRSPIFVAFVGLFQGLFDDWRLAVIIAQAVLSAVIPVCIYAAARRGGMTVSGAWAAALLSIASYELSRWNSYILTDALCVFFVATSMCAAVYALSSRSPTWAIVVGMLLAGAQFVRPAGGAAVAAVSLAACLVRPPARLTIVAGLAVIALYAAVTALSAVPAGGRQPPLTVCVRLLEGRVLWGSESYRVAPLSELLPGQRDVATPECVARTVTQHPSHVANVMIRRVLVFWLPVYPHYSLLHNAANVFLLGVPTLLAVFGLFRGPRPIRDDVVRLVPAAMVVVFTLFHMLTWVEGDHRFLAPVLPAVYLLAGVAIGQINTKKMRFHRPVPRSVPSFFVP